MARNNPLTRVVLTEMFHFLEPRDQRIRGLDLNFGLDVILALSIFHIDEEARIKLGFVKNNGQRSLILGHGYNLNGLCNGVPAEEAYHRMLKFTEANSGQAPSEFLECHGITDKKYGWYLTTWG